MQQKVIITQRTSVMYSLLRWEPPTPPPQPWVGAPPAGGNQQTPVEAPCGSHDGRESTGESRERGADQEVKWPRNGGMVEKEKWSPAEKWKEEQKWGRKIRDFITATRLSWGWESDRLWLFFLRYSPISLISKLCCNWILLGWSGKKMSY